MRQLVALLVLLPFCPAAAAAGATCPEAELRKDPDPPVRFVDLDGLHRSYLKFGGCRSDVYVDLARATPTAFRKVLVERWSELERLDMRCRKDPRFRRFVLGFIDATGDGDALARLARLSASCERKAKALCQDVHRRAVEALREGDSIGPSGTARGGGSR